MRDRVQRALAVTAFIWIGGTVLAQRLAFHLQHKQVQELAEAWTREAASE